MNSKIKTAIEKLLNQIIDDGKLSDNQALKFTQAVSNLANAAATLAITERERKQ